jgi:hypothetical protein
MLASFGHYMNVIVDAGAIKDFSTPNAKLFECACPQVVMRYTKLQFERVKIWYNTVQIVSCITTCAGPHSNSAASVLRLVC